jgi:hypothetical protein
MKHQYISTLEAEHDKAGFISKRRLTLKEMLSKYYYFSSGYVEHVLHANPSVTQGVGYKVD